MSSTSKNTRFVLLQEFGQRPKPERTFSHVPQRGQVVSVFQSLQHLLVLFDVQDDGRRLSVFHDVRGLRLVCAIVLTPWAIVRNLICADSTATRFRHAAVVISKDIGVVVQRQALEPFVRRSMEKIGHVDLQPLRWREIPRESLAWLEDCLLSVPARRRIWLLVDLDLRLRKIHEPIPRDSRRRIQPLLRGTVRAN